MRAIHCKVQVRGKVQGVFFRKSTQEQAKKLGLTGFVQNMPDRSVYLEAEGEAQAVKALLTWCHQGPPMACVDTVEVEESRPLGTFSDFEIRYV